MRKAIVFGIVVAAGLGVVLKTRAAAPPPKASGTPFCSGLYADDFSSLSAAARDFDHRPEATFSYCARNVAVYECLSYGSDGAIRRDRRKVTLHGTAFAYRKQGGDTLLLTNDHVAAWPAVTDGQHTLDDVPAGCKRVSEALTLVDDEHDTYAKDDIPLTRIVTDPQLDIGVLKAHADLHVIPWKVGHSAGIHERNLVEVRGFPLGAFRATNIGKVVSAHDHDDYGDWDHDDFIVDALLSKGNSGSPVLAISCVTGEYELVGVYHAGYSEGSALNAVIGVDQIRDLMSTLKRTPHDRDDTPVAVDAAARSTITAALSGGNDTYFPFGAQVALARQTAAGGILFAVFPKDFPSVGDPELVVEDLPASDPASFGVLGRLWLGSSRGLRRHELSAFDSEGQGQLKHALVALRADLAGQLAYRSAEEESAGARPSDGGLRRLAKALARAAASRSDLLQGIADLADHWSPQPGETGERLAALGRLEPERPQPTTIARSTVSDPPATPVSVVKPLQ